MHDDALTKEASRLLPSFVRLKSFYLVGGTALALQIGHRLSVDFDFFSREDLPERLLQNVRRVFREAQVEATLRTAEQVNCLINNIKTTFFSYPYDVVLPFIEYKNVPIISIKELAAMKAFAIGKRLSYKDYVDWYFLLQERHINLEETIAIAEKKYGGDFNDRLFLEQLASLSDIRTSDIDFLRDEVDRGTMEKFFKKTIQAFTFKK
jgi:hypothetical protein